jgi:hypothetical protein
VGYPSGIQTFTTKSAGQTIQPADINTPQTEITAIETGILNGFQHGITVAVAGITQSASTGSNNFAGPSTFAGDVVFTGAVTANSFAGPVTFSSGVTVSTGLVRQNSLPAWSVYANGAVAVANGSSGGLQWTAQDFVRGNVSHNTGVASSAVTVNSTGLYAVSFNSKWHSGANPRLSLTVRLGAADLLTHYAGDSDATVPDTGIAFHGVIRVDSTGVLSVVYHETNAASTLGSGTVPDAARFMGHFLG